MVNVHDLKTLAEKSAEQQNEDKREAEMDKESGITLIKIFK